MSSTLLKNIRVYKCNEPEHWNDTIYAVLVNTAESNIFPQTCHYWTIAAGQKYEVLIPIHRVQLSRNFSQQFGVTISGYLRNLRLQKGLELLRETRLTIEGIALSSGFASADYFGKVFRHQLGIAPGQYRELYSPFPSQQPKQETSRSTLN